jgi:hypothetical protein
MGNSCTINSFFDACSGKRKPSGAASLPTGEWRPCNPYYRVIPYDWKHEL